MKKHLLTLFLVAASAVLSYGQTASALPDAYGYTWKNSNDPNGPTFNWLDISAWPGTVNVSGLADDNIVGPFTLTVPFHFYWYDPSLFYIGSNGYIEFDKNATVASPFPVIPNITGIQDYLAGMTSDLTFTTTSGAPIPQAKCMYWQNSDSLIVTWDSVPFWSQTGQGFAGINSFQIILNNTDSSITYQYLIQSGTTNGTSNFLTIGIESKAGSIGLPYEQGGLSSDFYPTQNTAVKFYHPGVDTAAINDVSTTYVNNASTGALFLSKNGAPFTSVAEMTNTGNRPQNPFDFYSRVVNRLSVIQVRDTVQIGATTPGQSQVVTFPDTWTPTDTGTFRQIVQTNLGASDMVPSNNLRTLEIRVLDTTQTNVVLSYDDGIDDGTGGLGWAGGGGGGGVYFIPPFTPCTISLVSAYIVGNANNFDYNMYIVDDDGPNGDPLTILDSVNVPAGSVNIGGWNYSPLNNPVTITSGGFYLAWMMGGDGISLGQNSLTGTNPVSNRTYEILGPVSNPNSWSPWRSREIQDMLINAWIDGVTGINEESNAINNAFGNIYPNPSSEKIFLNYDVTSFDASEMSVDITSINGQQIRSNVLAEKKGTLEINVSDLASGSYVCRVKVGATSVQRVFTVAH